jgi:hypothetical protein
MPVPNHIKIDVDGTEFSVIKGMTATLADPSVRSVMLELNNGRGDSHQVVEFLAEKRFRVQSTHGANCLFVRMT